MYNVQWSRRREATTIQAIHSQTESPHASTNFTKTGDGMSDA